MPGHIKAIKDNSAWNLVCTPRISSFLTTVMLFAGIAFTADAKAALQIITFSGKGTNGSIVFDNSTLDSDPNPLTGRYLGAIVAFEVKIDGTLDTGTGEPTFSMLRGATGSVIVGIDACRDPVNCLAFLLGSNSFPPTDPGKFDLTFYYPAGSFSSDALPLSVPASGESILRSDFKQFYLGANAVSAVALPPVPEASTSALFGLGVCT